MVQAEPLELGEELQAERVQHPLAGPAGHADLADLGRPLREDGEQRQCGGGPHRAERQPGDALVDAVPDQHRQQQAHPGVDGDEQQAGQQRRPKPLSRRRRPYDCSGRTARASSTSGVSVAGGSASSRASSSGVAPGAEAGPGAAASRSHRAGVMPRSASNSASSSSRTVCSSSSGVPPGRVAG